MRFQGTEQVRREGKVEVGDKEFNNGFMVGHGYDPTGLMHIHALADDKRHLGCCSKIILGW